MTRITLDLVRQRLAGRIPLRVQEHGLIEAAVAVILVPTGAAELETLLIRRAEHPGDTWSGQMAFPGGRREAGDADRLGTAIRETREETGVGLDPSYLLGDLDDLHPRSPVLPPVVVRPFVFALPARPPIRPSAEVAGSVWIALDALPRLATTDEVIVRGVPRVVHGYRIGDDLVWGMTERIITPFLELLR